MKKTLFLFFLLFSGAAMAQMQDTIVKKNGDVLKVKVTEIGTEEIKFKTTTAPDAPIISIKKSDVKTIKVGGQTIYSDEEKKQTATEDVLIKKNGDVLKITVTEIGTEEIKFKLYNNPDGPIITVNKSEIRTLKIGGQLVIDNKEAQDDIIVKKDGSTTLKVKIVEMGNKEIKFRLPNEPDGPIITINKSEVKTVKIKDQIVYEYKPDPFSTSNSGILDKTSSIKFHFFSPLRTHLALTYEWMNKPGFNFEAGLGIIGVGVKPINDFGNGVSNPKGAFLRFGPKFLLGNSSDIEIEGARYAHPLKGRYFKVEMILQALNTRNFVDTGSFTTTRVYYTNKYQSVTLNLIYGRQNIYGNAVTVGYYFGVGYSLESKTTIGKPVNTNWYYDYDSPRRYSHVYFGKEFPLTLTAGFTIGLIHKTPDRWKGKKSYKNNPRSK
jgi:hypothetical protein